jgi:aryl-alcohol dehydrogenase-like predicted oxidoreductase
VSNYDAAQMAGFDRIRPVETLQPPYHLFRRGIEREILPYTRENNIGVLAYSPLASGLLTGTLTPESTFEPDDWRAHSSAFQGETLRRNLAVVDRLAELAAGKGISVSQLAIAWVLAQPGVHVGIVGARSARNIENSLAAADVDLTDEELAEIERIVADGVSIEGASPEGVA